MSKKLFIHLLIGSLSIVACSNGLGRNNALQRIEKAGVITVNMPNNAHCYYTYRDQDMGFEYDLAKGFADFLGVKLKVVVPEAWDRMLPSLDEGTVDVVAASMTITSSRLKLADFSDGYMPVQQMVITQKGDIRVRGTDDLSGKTLHVPRGTSYEDTLHSLKRKGLDISIELIDHVSTEDLIGAVARGEIETTVAYSNVALLNRRYYPDIRIAFPVGKSEPLGWAVRKGEKALLDKVNEFFDTIERDGTFKDISNRYYAYLEKFDHMDIKRFQQRIATRLPKYENTIRKAAELCGFDWRLIAALIYQESQFRPWAKSFSGVRGLMQLTLPTARDMGVKNRLDPRQSILGGSKYLKKLYDVFEEAPDPHRMSMALAAYNVGKGHIRDAQRIATEMDLDPNKWSSLEKTLPLLRQRKYYKKSKYGYCRGAEPVFHVQRTLTYYDILKRQAIEYTGGVVDS